MSDDRPAAGVRLASDEFVSGRLLQGLKTDRTLAYHSSLLREIDDLTNEDIQRALSTFIANAPFVDLKAGDLE